MADEGAPSRFALCEVEEEPDRWTDGWVHAYGVAWSDRALTWRPDAREIAFHHSAESALRLWSHGHNLRLIWVDPIPN